MSGDHPVPVIRWPMRRPVRAASDWLMITCPGVTGQAPMMRRCAQRPVRQARTNSFPNGWYRPVPSIDSTGGANTRAAAFAPRSLSSCPWIACSSAGRVELTGPVSLASKPRPIIGAPATVSCRIEILAAS